MTDIDLDRLVPEYIREFSPYIPSRPDPELKRLFGCSRLYRLNNNENALGPAPMARKTIDDFPSFKGAVYPSGDSYYLRQEIAKINSIDPDQIIVGNGANEGISFVIKAFCRQGDNIVTADRTFAVYEWVAIFTGIDVKLTPLVNETFDYNAILSQIDAGTKVVFICNPNNPTGTYWTKDVLKEFLDNVGGKQIVVLDEAYFEFVEAPDYPDGIKLINEYPNLVVFRTFSKMFGLAGLRIGYLAASPEVAEMIRRACIVYSVNAVAQEAAIASLRDDSDHIARTRAMVRGSREFLLSELASMNLPVIAGEGNFMMIKLPISDTFAYRKLMREGVMIRTMSGFRYPNYIRVTLAGIVAMEAFAAALKKILV